MVKAKRNVIDWHSWKAALNDKEESGDYLRVQQCCTGCGNYIGHLPGYWFIEDCDMCPDCRKENNEETWREEVMRLNDDSEEDRNDCSEELAKLGL